MKKIIEFVIVI